MKFLTIRQPWASLIAVGAKTIETRPFGTKYRGPLAIHAGKPHPDLDWEGGGYAVAADWFGKVRTDFAYRNNLQNRVDLPLGAVVAVCDLTDVVPIVEYADACEDRCVQHNHGRLEHWDQTWLLRREEGVDVSDQLPFGDFTPGRYAWLLENVRPVDPVPMKGAQGLRDLPGDVLPQVIAQVSR